MYGDVRWAREWSEAVCSRGTALARDLTGTWAAALPLWVNYFCQLLITSIFQSAVYLWYVVVWYYLRYGCWKTEVTVRSSLFSCWLLMMVMLLNKMTPLEFTFGNRQKPTDICSDFYFKIPIWTVSHNHGNKVTHTHMHTLFPHADTAQTEQPESPRAINISLSASKCIRWSFWEHAYICLSIFEICIWFCTSTNAAKLPFALLCCALSWEAHRLTEGCIQRMVDFKRLLDSLCALPSVGGGWADQPSSTILALTNTGQSDGMDVLPRGHHE